MEISKTEVINIAILLNSENNIIIIKKSIMKLLLVIFWISVLIHIWLCTWYLTFFLVEKSADIVDLNYIRIIFYIQEYFFLSKKKIYIL